MAGKLDLNIDQGSDYKLLVTIKDSTGTPVDITNHTFKGEIRPSYSSKVLSASFSFNILDQGVNPGKVEVLLPAADSAAIELKESNSASRSVKAFAYDIESDDGTGARTRWLEGVVNLNPEVTK